MSETKRTPGPWFDWENGEWLYEPQRLLANYPDACVMAAAPELLAACEMALRESGCDGDLCAHYWHEVMRAEVAKAKGETSAGN